MALYNEILVGRFNELLTRMFGLKGQGSPAPQLAGEIAPSFDLGAPPIEARYIGGEQVWCGYGAAPAGGAGKNAFASLNNPTGSNVIAVVERVAVYVAINYEFNLGIDVNLRAGTIGPVLPRDSRLYNGPYPYKTAIGITFAGDAVGAPAVLGPYYGNLARQPTILDDGWVLCPGSALVVYSQTQNQAILGSFSWRQRPLNPSEL